MVKESTVRRTRTDTLGLQEFHCRRLGSLTTAFYAGVLSIEALSTFHIEDVLLMQGMHPKGPREPYSVRDQHFIILAVNKVSQVKSLFLRPFHFT